LEELGQDSTSEDLELNRKNMYNFIDGPIQVITMSLMLQNEIDIGSKTMYLNAMEARVYFHPGTIMLFGDIITQYKSWHHM